MSVIIDLATLTGAAVVGLGEHIAALYSDHPALAASVLRAAGESCERMCQLPLEKSYKSMIKSKIADIKVGVSLVDFNHLMSIRL